jgi:hypothetical protein
MLGIPTELSDLARIEITDYELFAAAVEDSNIVSWSYYFPYLYFLGNLSGSRSLLYEKANDSILVYMLRKRDEGLHLSLFVPPFPFHPNSLRHARDRMRDFNRGRTSRIARIQESEALAVAREGFSINFRMSEYIYNRASVIALEGSGFQRLRRSISQYINAHGTVVRDYTEEDQQVCAEILKKWYGNLTSTGVKIGPYFKYTRECLKNFGKFSENLLSGQVIEVNGVIGAFSFGGPINKDYGSVFITVSDHDWPGLAYLQRHCLMARFPELLYFNDFTDSGRPGLAQMKRSFRPIKMHGLYAARE